MSRAIFTHPLCKASSDNELRHTVVQRYILHSKETNWNKRRYDLPASRLPFSLRSRITPANLDRLLQYLKLIHLKTALLPANNTKYLGLITSSCHVL